MGFFSSNNSFLSGRALSYKEKIILLKYLRASPLPASILYSLLYPQHQGPKLEYLWLGKWKIETLARLKWRTWAKVWALRSNLLPKKNSKKIYIIYFYREQDHHKEKSTQEAKFKDMLSLALKDMRSKNTGMDVQGSTWGWVAWTPWNHRANSGNIAHDHCLLQRDFILV